MERPEAARQIGHHVAGEPVFFSFLSEATRQIGFFFLNFQSGHPVAFESVLHAKTLTLTCTHTHTHTPLAPPSLATCAAARSRDLCVVHSLLMPLYVFCLCILIIFLGGVGFSCGLEFGRSRTG